MNNISYINDHRDDVEIFHFGQNTDVVCELCKHKFQAGERAVKLVGMKHLCPGAFGGFSEDICYGGIGKTTALSNAGAMDVLESLIEAREDEAVSWQSQVEQAQIELTKATEMLAFCKSEIEAFERIRSTLNAAPAER